MYPERMSFENSSEVGEVETFLGCDFGAQEYDRVRPHVAAPLVELKCYLVGLKRPDFSLVVAT